MTRKDMQREVAQGLRKIFNAPDLATAQIWLKEMIEKGKIKPVVDKIYFPEQAPEAHERVETEHRLGSVVISMWE